MPSKKIEEFARILIHEVRDAAIQDLDMCVRLDNQSSTAKRWRRAKMISDPNALRELIPDCVDEALFFLLKAIDEGLLKVQFVAADGTVVDLSEEGLGELAGWYSGPGGFCDTYSQMRLTNIVDSADDEAS